MSKKPRDPDAELQRARRRATTLLAQTDRSRAELEDKLVRAGFESRIVAAVLREFTASGLINDRALAERLVERTLNDAPADRPLLEARLRRKGVAESEADRAVDAALRTRDQSADARDAAMLRLKRMSGLPALPARTIASRLAGYLARRGFGDDAAALAIERALASIGRSLDEPDRQHPEHLPEDVESEHEPDELLPKKAARNTRRSKGPRR